MKNGLAVTCVTDGFTLSVQELLKNLMNFYVKNANIK